MPTSGSDFSILHNGHHISQEAPKKSNKFVKDERPCIIVITMTQPPHFFAPLFSLTYFQEVETHMNVG
jgi:hypothetical protein